MPRIPIDSLDDPRVQAYRNLKASNLSRHGEWFIAEGTKLVERLIDSDYETISVLLTAKREAEWLPRIPEAVPVYILPQDLGSELVGFQFHVGVVACGRRKPSPTIDDAIPPEVDPLTLVICPNCDNPENLGAIIRIACGFGAQAILLGKGCSDPFSRRVLRVPMGTAFRATIIESNHLEHDLQRLRTEWDLRIYGTTLAEDAVPLAGCSRTPRLGLMFGNEHAGLDDRWLSLCDKKVTIPMAPGIDSLNVAVAAGIFLHHFLQVR